MRDTDYLLYRILKKMDPKNRDDLEVIVTQMGTNHFADVLVGMCVAIRYERDNDSATREA